jgi:hypothetical protein
MKRVFLAILFAGSVLSACSQSIYVSAIGESTVTGLQYGGAIGYRSGSHFQVGGFFQTGRAQSEAEPVTPSRFYGVETVLPVVRSVKIDFALHFRAGLSNDQFVVIVPGLLTVVNVARNFQLGTGLGWRYGKPSVQAQLQFKL